LGGSSTYNLSHYCYFHDTGEIADQENGSVITHYGTGVNYNVMQYNNYTRGGHDTGLSTYGPSYNQWKNSLHDGGWGLGWECVMGPGDNYNLFEGNEIKDVATIGHAYKPGIELSTNYNTARRNIVYDGYAVNSNNASGGIELSYSPTSNKVYNNTFVHNGRSGITFYSGSGNTVSNNIFYDNCVGGYTAYGREFLSDSTNPGSMNKNLFSNPASTSVISRNWGSNVTVVYANTNYAEFGGTGNNYDNTQTIDFIDYAGRELHLKSTSQLIGKGVSVTDTTWGTIGETDLGAFKYYAIEGGVPSVPNLTGVTISGGTVK
jgi:parallel beta-helix repeat protein